MGDFFFLPGGLSEQESTQIRNKAYRVTSERKEPPNAEKKRRVALVRDMEIGCIEGRRVAPVVCVQFT